MSVPTPRTVPHNDFRHQVCPVRHHACGPRRLAEIESGFDPLPIDAAAHARRVTLYTRDPADLAGLEDAITWRVV